MIEYDFFAYLYGSTYIWKSPQMPGVIENRLGIIVLSLQKRLKSHINNKPSCVLQLCYLCEIHCPGNLTGTAKGVAPPAQLEKLTEGIYLLLPAVSLFYVQFPKFSWQVFCSC